MMAVNDKNFFRHLYYLSISFFSFFRIRNPEPIPTAIADITQEYSCSLKRTNRPKPIMIIPKNFDYNQIKSLSNESREKFINIKPQTVGQAQRINGIRPTDISILLVYLRRPFHVKQI